MEKEFITMLDKDEEILVHKYADVSKTSKQYKRFLLGFIVILLFGLLTIVGTKSSRAFSFDFRILMAFGVLIILAGCLLWGFFYNTFFKYKNKNNEYFVTNKKVALYNPKKGFRVENISDIVSIGIFREKNNYGDISFNFSAKDLIDQMKKVMEFEGIENPREIVSIICKINNKIHTYDDRPTIMGRKV